MKNLKNVSDQNKQNPLQIMLFLKTPHYVINFLIFTSSLFKLSIVTQLIFWKYIGHDPKTSTTSGPNTAINMNAF